MTWKVALDDQARQILGFLSRVIVSIILGYMICFFLWDFLIVPLSPSIDIVGPLPLQNIDPKTNIVRLCALVFLPMLIFLILIRGRNIPTLRDPPASGLPRSLRSIVGCIGTLLLVILLARCFWVVVPEGPLDFFHEGEFLVPAFNTLAGKGLWTGSYFIHGLFYDLYATLMSWRAFGHETIGAMRMGHQVWSQVTELVVPFAVGSLLLTLFGSLNDKRFWASLFTIESLYLTYSDYQHFNSRDLPLLLGVTFLALGHHFKKSISFFIAGLMSGATYFVVIDRGAYYNALLIVLAIAGFLKPRFGGIAAKSFVALGSGVAVSWLAFILFVGKAEFLAFLDTTLSFYREKDYFDAYLLPNPFTFENKAWSAYGVLLTAATLGSVAVLALWRTTMNSGQRFVFLILGALSFFYSRSGIARSDLGHLAYSASFAFILVTILMLWVFFLSGRIRNWVLYGSLLMMVSNICYLLGKFEGRHFIASSVITDFVARPDISFLTNDQQVALGAVAIEFHDEPCTFNLTITEPVWPFLLKKPSCSRYFVPWFIGSRKRQEEYWTSIVERRPKVVLGFGAYWGGVIDQIPSEQRLSLVHDRLKMEYAMIGIEDAWKIYRRRL